MASTAQLSKCLSQEARLLDQYDISNRYLNMRQFGYNVYNKQFFKALALSAAITTPFFFRGIVPDYSGPLEGQREFQDRTVIITGANGKIGSAAAYQFARRKFRVILACRNMEDCKILRRELVFETKNYAIACRYLDLEDISSINKFADEMIHKEPTIDVLVNNAAVKKVKERELTKYGIEKHYFVNFLAPFLLTFRLMDKLAESSKLTGGSRVINVIGKPKKNWKVVTKDINFDIRRYSSDKAYRQSKLALAYFTILFEKYNIERGNNIFVYGVSPCYNSITDMRTRPTGFWEKLKALARSFFSIDSFQAASNIARCGIEPSYLDRSKSGQLYTYLARYWGWGTADKDENHAKLVWNHAQKLLLDIPDEPRKTTEEQPTQTSENQSNLAPVQGKKDGDGPVG